MGATVGSGLADACSGLGPQPLPHIDNGTLKLPTPRPLPTLPPYYDLSSNMTPIERLIDMNKANTERSWGITQCVVAVDLAATYLIRVATQIETAGAACVDRTDCGLNVLNIVSSILWAAQFFAAIAS